MNLDRLKKYALPPGPILSITLIGVLLLGGMLYYRAIKIQRFLEPALAMSQPRFEFADRITREIHREFGTKNINWMRFTTDSISIEKKLIIDEQSGELISALIPEKLAAIFLTILKDPKLRGNVDVIVLSTKYIQTNDMATNNLMRLRMQHESEKILSSLFKAQPELETIHGVYFAATSLPVLSGNAEIDRVEFKIVPSEQLHIDVLLRLEKYAR